MMGLDEQVESYEEELKNARRVEERYKALLENVFFKEFLEELGGQLKMVEATAIYSTTESLQDSREVERGKAVGLSTAVSWPYAQLQWAQSLLDQQDSAENSEEGEDDE